MGLIQLNYLYNKGKIRDALAHLEAIESHYQPDHPDFFEIKLTKARILLELGKYEEGEKMLNSLLDLGRKGGKLTRIDMVILLTDILWRKGDWEQAYFMQEMGEYDLFKIGNEIDSRESDLRYAELKRLKGIYARYTGELDAAMEYFSHCLYAAEKSGDNRLLAKIFNLLGQVHLENGEPTKAWSYLFKAYELRKELQDEAGAAFCKYHLANLKENLGEYTEALEDYKDTFRVADQTDNERLKALSISSMGILSLKMGQYGVGMELITSGLELLSELGNDIDTSWNLYYLLKLLLQSEKAHLAPIFLDGMEELYEENQQHPLILQQHRLITAYYLMNNEKTIDKAKAQQLFKQVMEDRVINVELNISALLAYTNMLLDELKTLPDQEIVYELGDLFEKLNDLIDDQQSIPVILEANLLMAKLAIMELDFKKALAILTSTNKIVEERNIKFLEHRINRIHENIMTRVEEISTNDKDQVIVFTEVEKSEIEERVAQLIAEYPIEGGKAKATPVLFMITSSQDEPIVKLHLDSQEKINDLMIQKMIAALSSMFEKEFSNAGFVERIKHGNYFIISRKMMDFYCHLVVKGPANSKMITLLDDSISKIEENDEIINQLTSSTQIVSEELLDIIKQMMA